MRKVKCTDAFFAELDKYIGPIPDEPIPDLQTWLILAANWIIGQYLTRFLVALGSMLPLVLCVWISMDKR
ncbi:hypothetical protein AAVH_39588, partial [Aphelenchoides avenae]